MKNIQFIIIIGIILLFSCNKENKWDCIKGAGEIKEERVELSKFIGMDINHDFNIYIYPDSSDYIDIKGGENLLDKIETEIYNDTLKVRNHNTCNWVRSFKKKVELHVHTTSLIHILYAGISEVTFKDTLKADVFRLDIHDGHGTLNLLLNTNRAYVQNYSGHADVNIKGRTPYYVAFQDANGPIDSRHFHTPYSKIIHRSECNTYIYASDSLKAFIEFMGDVYYYGNPTKIILENPGRGELIKGD